MKEGGMLRDRRTSGRLFLPALLELSARVPEATVDEVCARAGLTRESLADLRARLPLAAVVRFLRLSTAATGEPTFAIRAGRRFDHIAFDLYMRTLIVQSDGEAAMSLAQRFAALAIDSLEITYVPEEGRQRIVLTMQGQPIDEPLLAEYLAGLLARISELVGRSRLPLLDVEFVHPPRTEMRLYREAIGAPAHFERARTSFALPDVNLSLPEADPVLATLLEDQARSWLDTLPRAATTRARVEAVLRARLGQGPIALDDVAQALALSSRTLRRRLEDEGTSYGEVLDDFRRERSLALVRDESRSIGAIASAVGFESPGAFRRAFVRWTGRSATDYRARLDEG